MSTVEERPFGAAYPAKPAGLSALAVVSGWTVG